MANKQEKMLKGFKEIQAERISVYPAGVDSKGQALAYIVQGNQLWYAKDDKLTPVELPQEDD